MKKFSAGGAQGRYDRRMADIDKDFKKDSAGKTGRALEVLEAKRMQRTADAKDDLAKRTGADRTATRKAEYDAEKNLSRTRKFGADKPAAEPAKTTAPAAAPAPEAAKAKPQSFGAAFKEARARLGAGKTFTYNGKSFTTNIAGEGRKASTGTGMAKASTTPVKAASTPVKAASTPVKASTTPVKAASTPVKAASTPVKAATTIAPSGIALLQATKVAREKKEAEERKKRIGMPAHERMAKGGKVKKEKTMKYAKGGATAPANSKTPKTGGSPSSKPMPKEPITGGADTVPLTPGRKEFLKELAKRNAKPGMAKGGKATKFGAAMKKKSADTKGRAMMKFAKGGSIDGCAVKGKTKTSMIKMKNGGSC
jgi:hypothetical protein